jgi:hypothetical protein
MTDQLPPSQRAAIAVAIVNNKTSLGLADMADERVMEQAADIYAALLVVCAGIDRDVAAGKPGAVAKALALKWFSDVCLNEPAANAPLN